MLHEHDCTTVRVYQCTRRQHNAVSVPVDSEYTLIYCTGTYIVYFDCRTVRVSVTRQEQLSTRMAVGGSSLYAAGTPGAMERYE
jgi:hypothetical protein